MPNSIRTTSNTQTTTNSTSATFKAGDSVLCPTIGGGIYTLLPNGQSTSRLIIRDGEKAHAYHLDGRIFHDSPLPSIFHDTPANRAAIATLYALNIVDSVERLSNDSVQNSVHSNVEPCSNNREENHLEAKDYRTVEQRFSGISGFCSPALKVINSIDDDDDEAVLISACKLSDTACEILGAAEVMHDIGQLLHLIYSEKISTSQVKSMARLVRDTTDRWDSILGHLLDTLNEPLEQTKYGKVEG